MLTVKLPQAGEVISKQVETDPIGSERDCFAPLAMTKRNFQRFLKGNFVCVDLRPRIKRRLK